MKAVRRIIRYLNGTQNIGLWYDRESTLILNAYTDSDFAGCKIDRNVLVVHVNSYDAI